MRQCFSIQDVLEFDVTVLTKLFDLSLSQVISRMKVHKLFALKVGQRVEKYREIPTCFVSRHRPELTLY